MTYLMDAHVHFSDPDARHHVWLEEHPRLRRTFGPDDLDAGRHELIGAVFVQADCRDDEALDEARWVERLAAEHPLIQGVVAYAPVHRGGAVQRHLEALARNPLVVGVRRLLQGHPTELITNSSLVRGVRLLADWNLSFDVCVTHDQLPAVATLVRSCPRTSFVLDHLGKPPVASGEVDPWRENLARIASFPNVGCKLSGLATEAPSRWRETDVRPYLEHALATFGPRRCMIASDWPVLTLRTTAERWFDVVLEVIAELRPEERAAVLRETAIDTYGLVVPELKSENGKYASGGLRR